MFDPFVHSSNITRVGASSLDGEFIRLLNLFVHTPDVARGGGSLKVPEENGSLQREFIVSKDLAVTNFCETTKVFVASEYSRVTVF